MHALLQSDKRGVSEIVSYVILIVIAIGLSVSVYAFLKVYVPDEAPSCPADTAVAIEDISCAGGNLSVTLVNRGLFKVHGTYVRFDLEKRNGREVTVHRAELSNDTSIYFTQGQQVELLPGSSAQRTYRVDNLRDIPYTVGENYSLQIQPLILTEKGVRVACEQAVVARRVQCR